MRAIAFDFDGLILDTETPEVETWRAVFTEHGAEFPDAWWQNAIGRGAEQVMTVPEDLLEEQIGRTIDRPGLKASHHRRLLAAIDAQPVRPGVSELVEAARREGIPYAIASSSGHDWIEGHLSRLGVRDLFPLIVGREDAERGKPFPDLYLEACRRLGTEPADTLALEDSPNGVRAAKAAGLVCFAVVNPVTAFLDLSQADARLETLEGETLESLRERFSRSAR